MIITENQFVDSMTNMLSHLNKHIISLKLNGFYQSVHVTFK